MTRHGKRTSDTFEPSQRQLRAGELIRHALADIMTRKEIQDPDLYGVSITVGEVRCSPDLRQADIFCSPLGLTTKDDIERISVALNRVARFLRGRIGRKIDMKFTPQLRFIPDLSYNHAQAMDSLFQHTQVARDLDEDNPDRDTGALAGICHPAENNIPR